MLRAVVPKTSLLLVSPVSGTSEPVGPTCAAGFEVSE